jgi:hypothetical protein
MPDSVGARGSVLDQNSLRTQNETPRKLQELCQESGVTGRAQGMSRPGGRQGGVTRQEELATRMHGSAIRQPLSPARGCSRVSCDTTRTTQKEKKLHYRTVYRRKFKMFLLCLPELA